MIGLATCRSAPAAMARGDLLPRMASAVRDDDGGHGRAAAQPPRRWMARMAVRPSIRGMWVSIRITSKTWVRAASTAASPSATTVSCGQAVQHGLDDLLVDQVVLGQQHRHRAGVDHGPAAARAAVGRDRAGGQVEGRGEAEHRALAGNGVAFDRAAHHPGQPLGDGQAQARAAEAAGDRAVALLEAAEQPGP